MNNCTVLIFNYFILFSYFLVGINFADIRLDLGSNAANYCSGSGGSIYTVAR